MLDLLDWTRHERFYELALSLLLLPQLLLPLCVVFDFVASRLSKRYKLRLSLHDIIKQRLVPINTEIINFLISLHPFKPLFSCFQTFALTAKILIQFILALIFG